MEDKDYIKDLFSEKLEGFEAKVDPSVWTSIQSQMAANTVAATSATGIALGTKIAALIGGIAIIGTAGYFVFSGKEETSIKIVEEKSTKEITEENSVPSKQDLIIDTNDLNKEESKVDSSSEDNEIISILPTPPTVVDDVSNLNAGNIENTKPKESVNATVDSIIKNDLKTEAPEPLTTSISVEKLDANRYLFVSSNKDVDYVEWNFTDGNYSSEAKTQHVFNSPGKYEVQLTVFKGEEKTTVTEIIEIKQAGAIKAYPNIFSPNNDGVNDLFTIESENIDEFNLTLFNQKGNTVFKTDDVNFQWTGENIEDGKYYYVIIAKDIDGAMINEYHPLEIIRTRR